MPHPTPASPRLRPPRPSTGSTILPPLLFAASSFLSNDFTVIASRPLSSLHVPCPFIYCTPTDQPRVRTELLRLRLLTTSS